LATETAALVFRSGRLLDYLIVELSASTANLGAVVASVAL